MSTCLHKFARAVRGGREPEKAAADVRVQSALEAIADANNALVPAFVQVSDAIGGGRAKPSADQDDAIDAYAGLQRAKARLADARRQLEGLVDKEDAR